jgi:HlyD family secretion protein
MIVTAAVAVCLVVGGVVTWANWKPATRQNADTAVYEVQHGPLTISVSEAGTIQNRDLVVVKSEVEGKTSLLMLIPEGTNVEKGQLLAELDSSNLVDSKTKQEITVMNAQAAFIGAQENQAIVKSQGESDVRQAQLDSRFAELDLRKYQEGDYLQAVQQADTNIKIANEQLQVAKDKLEWSQKLAQEKFITRTELQGDELSADQAQLSVALAETSMKVLKEFTYGRTLESLKSNVEQTKAALERVTRKAKANDIQAEADLKAKESEFNRQKEALDKLVKQIDKCKIYAPVAGMVVYATTGQPLRGSQEPLAEGQDIRERQQLINLPTTASMMAVVNIHESSLRKIKKEQPVRITVDAVPGKTYQGRVGKIGILPDAQSAWMNPDLKVYATQIYIDGDAKDLRAGMTCKAEVVVETYPDAIFVPVQSVVRVQGKPTAYLPGAEAPIPRQVEIGMDNNRMVHILSGLTPGEMVLLAPPLGPSTAPIHEEEVPAVNPSTTPASPTPAASGTPAASDTAPASTDPAVAAPTATLPPGFDMAKFRSMTREERQKAMEGMTPEQSDAVRKLMGAGRRRPPGGGPAGGSGNPPPPDTE